MRIGCDIRPFLREKTGVGVYFKNLLFSLSKIDKTNEYYLFSSSFKDRFDTKELPPFAKMHFRDFHYPVKAINFFWYKFCWPPLEYFFKTGLDLTHSPSPLILPTKAKKIVTVYDLFFMEYPNLTDEETRNFFLKKIGDSLRESDGIMTISAFTKEELMKKFSLDARKIRVVFPGIDRKLWKRVPQDNIKKTRLIYKLPSSFLLFVGAFEPRKNLLNLVEALKIVHEKYRKIPLVLVGRKGQDSKKVVTKIEELNLKPWISLTGYVPEKDLKSFYILAEVFVFPSFCEGFGLPLLEAMACGVPITASNAPAIPEIAKDAALYFDPYEPEDIANKIILVLKDNELKRRLVENGEKRVLDFDWTTAAAETLKFYHEIFEKREE